jgi:hypothetical protein
MLSIFQPLAKAGISAGSFVGDVVQDIRLGMSVREFLQLTTRKSNFNLRRSHDILSALSGRYMDLTCRR